MRHKILSSVFVAAAVFSVSYFLNVVEEFRSCLSKPEGSVYYFGLSIGRAVSLLHFWVSLLKLLLFMLLFKYFVFLI